MTLFSYLATLSYWALTIYEWIIIITILLTWVNPDPSNPIIQFLNSMTAPLWRRIGAFLPGVLRFYSAYVSLLLVWFLKIFVPGTFTTLGHFSNGAIGALEMPQRIMGYFLLGAGIVTQNFVFFMILLLVLWFVLTMVSPSVGNPIVRTVYMLVDPLITPIQRRLPRTRYDLSPLIAAGALLLLNVLVVSELIAFAAALAHSPPGFSGSPAAF